MTETLPRKDEPVQDQTLADEDPFLDKMVLVFLFLFLLAVLFIPSEWFLKWSMWLNGVSSSP